MPKRMLIDATHAEETRVVVLDGNKLEDFDVETSDKRHLRGNIYLAKIVRVEPSLQAAFVEYLRMGQVFVCKKGIVVRTEKDLELTASQIASFTGGAIRVRAGGQIDVGIADFVEGEVFPANAGVNPSPFGVVRGEFR